MTQKPHFDVAIIVPLHEEFQAAIASFKVEENLSVGEALRLSVSLDGSPLSILLAQQSTMGRTAASEAVRSILDAYDVGLIVCVGIAGGLSSDLNIGDVVCSEGIIDVLDNAKAKGNDIALSPTYYPAPRELTVLVQLQRLLSEGRTLFATWQERQYEAAYSKLPETFVGKDKKNEQIEIPDVRVGTIACAMVSASAKYNRKLKAVDRRILAVETESGGVFATARQTPALTIRGIADYAGSDKTLFEEQTRGMARAVAIDNAVSYLGLLMKDQGVQAWLMKRGATTPGQRASSSIPSVASILADCATQIDDRLRELAPAFALQAKGYRLPIPRVRLLERAPGIADDASSEPLEIREALRSNRALLLSLPKEYPDNALSWIVAADLLTADLHGKQVIPVVLDAAVLHRPTYGLRYNCPINVLHHADAGNAHIVFLVDAFQFRNRRHSEFLAQEIAAFTDASVIVITRDKSQLWQQTEFLQEAGAAGARVSDVAFMEISYFLQKNFELRAPEAEVVAARLRETFTKFELPAHPTFFAGIPRDILAALLQANRRGELIELAVAGYLSFVVAGDAAAVRLNRTTRERFLTELAYDINVSKKRFSEVELIQYVEELSTRYDFAISPAAFVTTFVDAGILHFDGGYVRFTLPFIEAHLLAKRLHEKPAEAAQYFEFGTGSYNSAALALFCELGPDEAFVQKVFTAIDRITTQLKPTDGGHILFNGEINPRILEAPARMKGLRKSIERATLAVRTDQDKSREKQNLLDAYDRIRGSATRKSEEANEPGQRGLGDDAMEIWFVSLTLLGAGAERLEAATKRDLIRRILALASLITDDWTRFVSRTDFDQLKQEMLGDKDLRELLKPLQSTYGDDEEAFNQALSSLVDFIEVLHLAEPLTTVMSSLSEEAREAVLAQSLSHTTSNDRAERLFRATWYADIDVENGREELTEVVDDLPNSVFLRTLVAHHLLDRAFWRHARKEDRLTLLDIAERALSPVAPIADKGKLVRMLESKEQAEAEEEFSVE